MSARPTTNLAKIAADGGHVVVYDTDWEAYQRFLAYFGEFGAIRVAFCDGILEIMGKESLSHGIVSRLLAHLIGAYAMMQDTTVISTGSALIGSEKKNAGKNPDEAFWFGREPEEGEGPDLVVEVVMSSEAISKQSFYARFDVPEFWIWEEGKISVYLLKANGKGYKASKRSRIFPDLDMKLVERCSRLKSLNAADAKFRKALGC